MNAPSPQPAHPGFGPPPITLIRIRDLIYHAAGIFHPDNKLALLGDRCKRRMKALNLEQLEEYFERLTLGPTRHTELSALLNEITVGETCFFRSRPQLEALVHVVLPNILSAKAGFPVRRLRLWSAGCSTGEEPYTLRMMLLDAPELLKGWSLEILATDINERSLEHAQRAVYDSYSTRHLSAECRRKYFIPLSGSLQVAPPARSNIRFSRLNLSDDTRTAAFQNLDVIFCCNVLIYFDLASKRQVLRRFVDALAPHGYLFLGQSESLYGVSEDFRLIHLPRATAYMKNGPAARAGSES